MPSGWEKPEQSQSHQPEPSSGSPRGRDVVDTSALMFQIGVIMLIAFLGATIASRFRLSVIIGYIIAGILIGPHLRLSLWGASYNGLIKDHVFIQDLSPIRP